jgi:acetyltransferase AlgX (SGNH hydrolase-like protein)
MLYLLALLFTMEMALQGYYRFTAGALLYVRDKPPIWAADPFSGWTNRPNATYRHVTPEFSVDLHTNSQGFRVSEAHEEYTVRPSADTYRILLLGPSFAFGWGVDFEDTFGYQLQQFIAERGIAQKKRVEVLNHGVPALPAANQLEWFQQVGKNYSPDLVIHFVYGSLEVSPQPDQALIVTNGMLQPVGLSTKDILWGYSKNSATVFYTGIIMGQISKVVGAAGQGSHIEGSGRELHNASVFDVHSSTIKESTAFYQAFQEAVHEIGGGFLVVYFPLSYVVYAEDRARWALHGVENIEAQVTFNKVFAAHLNQQAIRCLNLTDDFIEHAKHDARRLYYWLDVHWTPLGNRRSAELVGQYLERENPGRASGAHDLGFNQ